MSRRIQLLPRYHVSSSATYQRRGARTQVGAALAKGVYSRSSRLRPDPHPCLRSVKRLECILDQDVPNRIAAERRRDHSGSYTLADSCVLERGHHDLRTVPSSAFATQDHWFVGGIFRWSLYPGAATCFDTKRAAREQQLSSAYSSASRAGRDGHGMCSIAGLLSKR